MVIGENPCVRSGAPVQIGWVPQATITINLDTYELSRQRNRRPRRNLILKAPQRAAILLRAGHSLLAIVEASNKAALIRKSRVATQLILKKKQGWERLNTVPKGLVKSVKKIVVSRKASLGSPENEVRKSMKVSNSFQQRLSSLIKERNASTTCDTEDTAQPKMNKAKDSMLFFHGKRMDSPSSSQGCNGKNASWDDGPQKDKKPSDAMLSILNLNRSGGSGMSMSKSKSTHRNLGGTMSSHRNLGSTMSMSSFGSSISRSSNKNPAG